MSVILAAAVMLGGFTPHLAAPSMVAPEPTPPATSVAPPATHGISGRASWYCCTHGYAAGELVAAAGPALRRRLGRYWRGSRVSVCGGSGRCVSVRLVDWCQCYKATGHEVLIDLQPGAFRRVASLSAGIVRVRVSW